MTDVIVVGSINVDLTSYLARWPSVGETVSAQSTHISLGGKGANQAVAAAKLSAGVSLIGALGCDGFGQDAEKELEATGISLTLNRFTDQSTGMAFIDVGPEGGNIIRLSPGANTALREDFVEQHADIIHCGKILLLQNEVPFKASLKAAEIARSSGVTVIMDPAPAPEPFWSTSDLAAFDILKPNAHEVSLVLGECPETLEDALSAAQDLRRKGPKGAIVTMGEKGVAWSIGSSSGTAEAPKVDAIDTVGAGDCFNGALAAALSNGRPVSQAIQTAVYAASLATTRKGAAIASPTLEELESFQRKTELCVKEISS